MKLLYTVEWFNQYGFVCAEGRPGHWEFASRHIDEVCWRPEKATEEMVAEADKQWRLRHGGKARRQHGQQEPLTSAA